MTNKRQKIIEKNRKIGDGYMYFVTQANTRNS